MARVVFLDTMIYLHYRPLEEIDFCQILSAEEVTILVPRITIRELDQKKNQHPNKKIQERARAALLKIEAALQGDGTISPHVVVELAAGSPCIDYEANGLRQDWSDDVLVASVLEYIQEHPEDEVSLISQDSGPRFQCSNLGIDAIQLEDEWRLPPQLSEEEVENRRLRGELERIKNALPRLKVVFVVEPEYTDKLDFTIPVPTQFDEENCKHLMIAAHEKYPPRSPTEPGQDSLAAFIQNEYSLGIGISEYERYARDRQRFFKEYQTYLEQLHDFQMRCNRTIEFEIAVLNTGSAPATDVDVVLHFPDGFDLSHKGGPFIPIEPTPPRQPRSKMEEIINASKFEFPEFPGTFQLPAINFSDFSIKRTNSYDVTDHTAQLKHSRMLKLPKLWLTFDSWESASSFHCDYTVHAGNLVDPVKGQLHFRIAKSE